jgi:transposase
VWLYGATRNIFSGRELERRCQKEAGFRWLCGRLSVSYHTLNDFRVNHGAALQDLLTLFPKLFSGRGWEYHVASRLR